MKKEKEVFKEEVFVDKWSTYKYLTEVKSDIKERVSSDFILAKTRGQGLEQHQIDAITELVKLAYSCEKEIRKLKKSVTYKVGKNGKYIKNQDNSYKQYPLTRTEMKYIDNLATLTFNSYMIKLTMIVVMNRNIDNNIIMELIAEKDKMITENEDMKKENEDLKERIKKNIKKGNVQE